VGGVGNKEQKLSAVAHFHTRYVSTCVGAGCGRGRGTKNKSKRIPFIFNDESTGSCICIRLDLYMSHVKKYNRYA
jgi:hypothetical protein